MPLLISTKGRLTIKKKYAIIKSPARKPGATRMSDMERTDFRVEGRHLVEIPPTDDDDVAVLMNEFKIQFQLSDT